MEARPLLALTVGDPAGIGPEIVAKALADPRVRACARVLALGPASCRPESVALLTPGDDPRSLEEHAWVVTAGERDWKTGVAQAAGGRAALAALRAGHELCHARVADGLVCAPVSKEALHLAGEEVEGQTELLGRWANAPDVQMLGIAGDLRVLLLTRHMPLAAALAALSTERVLKHILLLDEGLRRMGFEEPRLAVAGLNPHAGENGLLGHEEQEVLEPAVASARASGVAVEGPLSPDTVFVRASAGEFDGVLALYHDQAFIPLKLHAPGTGITVLLRMPYLRVSPAHGTAFSIAGTGRADPGNLCVAIEAAARLAPAYSASASACS